MHEPAPTRRRAVLSADTSADVERLQIDAWRRMTPGQRLQLVSATTEAVMGLAAAGIRRRHPGVTERECFLRLAALRLGVDTTRRLYPDAALLADLRGGR